ncbi:helix-turn-helix domain-containing protein [Streptococcus canis]|uniref:helix-turn-helix domain-containing protein n=1 Tax=Streptococcus dysgalactiae TaxID=1334 RepID=UPI0024ACC80A|nr:helix-turn-helix transcriptional regulator [Streptococcus canis]
MFITFERIKELAQKQGLSINSLEERMGYSRNTIYAIKRNQPGSEKLQQIADYFNVSTDYLLGRTDNPKIANNDETAIVNGQLIDLREAAASSMLFDGKPLDEDDIDFITAVLSAHFKNKNKD